MYQRPFLLCLSNNPVLLEIRASVLATQYRVIPLRGTQEMEALPAGDAFRILVLCHSLSEEECESAIRLAHARWPGIKVVSIATLSSVCPRRQSDAVIDSLAGAPALLQTVAYLINQAELCYL